jgi:hypothetical protein
MKTVAVVAWREIIEHRVFLAAALAALALSLVVPVASGLFKASPADVREIVMVCMVLGYVPLVALLLGASMVSGAVAAGRFGFFLGRPVAGVSIWFGKLAGALAVVFACEAILLLPALATSSLLLGETADAVTRLFGYGAFEALGEAVAFSLPLLLPLVLVLGAHAAATLWRGRTPWLAADLVTLLATVALATVALWPLARSNAGDAVVVVSSGFVLTFLLAIVAAGAIQTAAGGADARRQHGIFSATAAGVLLTASLVLTAFARGAASPSPNDLLDNGPEVRLSANGRWVAVIGNGWLDVPGGFLLDLDSETSVRMDVGASRWGSGVLAVSSSGRRAAWAVAQGQGTLQVMVADLTAEPVTITASPIFVSADAELALSPQGERLAVADQELFSISDLRSGAILASATIDVSWPYTVPTPLFVSEHTALVVDEGWFLSTLATELDAATGQVHRITPRYAAKWSHLHHDPSRDRILALVRGGDASHWRYVHRATFEDVEWTRDRPLGRRATLLADGRLVSVRCDDANCSLEVLRPDGHVEASHLLPAELQRILRHPRTVNGRSASIRFGLQPTSGGLAVEVERVLESSSVYDDHQESRVGIIDVESGAFRELDSALEPVGAWTWERGCVAPPPGSPASRLFRDAGGALLLWDPETGDMEDLAERYR